jgi:hypothetical protein
MIPEEDRAGTLPADNSGTAVVSARSARPIENEYFVRGMEALRDEINEFRTDMELWAVAKIGGRSP